MITITVLICGVAYCFFCFGFAAFLVGLDGEKFGKNQWIAILQSPFVPPIGAALILFDKIKSKMRRKS